MAISSSSAVETEVDEREPDSLGVDEYIINSAEEIHITYRKKTPQASFLLPMSHLFSPL